MVELVVTYRSGGCVLKKTYLGNYWLQKWFSADEV